MWTVLTLSYNKVITSFMKVPQSHRLNKGTLFTTLLNTFLKKAKTNIWKISCTWLLPHKCKVDIEILEQNYLNRTEHGLKQYFEEKKH